MRQISFQISDLVVGMSFLIEYNKVSINLMMYCLYLISVCPGLQLANRSLYITTALLLWSFNIREDPSRPIDNLAFTDTANVHPLPFKVIFEPRHANIGFLLEGL